MENSFFIYLSARFQSAKEAFDKEPGASGERSEKREAQ